MSSVIKGVVKLGKNILSGVKKAFKSVTKSSLGKALLLGATIYLGGAALGYWNSPFTSINGALAGTQAAAEGGSAATSVLGGGTGAETFGLGEAAAAPVAEALPAATVAPGAAEQTAAALAPVGQSVAGAAGNVVAGAAPTVAPAASKGGFIGKALSGDLTRYALINAGAGAVKAAFTPSATEQAEDLARIQREQEAWRQRFLAPNFDVGSINVGEPSGKPLTDLSGNAVVPPGFTRGADGSLAPGAQTGIIARAMR